MSELSPLSTGQVSRTGRVGPPAGRRTESTDQPLAASRDRGADQVQLSSHARHLDTLRDGGPVRTDLVNRIRAEIEQDTYETPEKLDAAIDEILTELE